MTSPRTLDGRVRSSIRESHASRKTLLAQMGFTTAGQHLKGSPGTIRVAGAR